MLAPENEDDALNLIYRMEGHFSKAFTGFTEDEQFYEGELEPFIEVPEGFDITIPTTARAVVDEAVDNVNPKDFLIYYPKRKNTKQAEKDSEVIRQWCRGLLQYWRTTGNDMDVLRDFLKNLFMSGKAILKIAPDYSLWPFLASETEKELHANGGKAAVLEAVDMIEQVRAENMPITLRSISPQCIIEDDTVGARKTWIIERYSSTPEEIKNLFSVDIEQFREYWNYGLPVHEMWTATRVDYSGRIIQGRHFIFANWTLVKDEVNKFGELPYIVRFSGFGREAYVGRPEFKAVGFFTRQNKSMLLAEARRHMQFDAIMSQQAFPVGFIPDELDLGSLDFSPGSLNPVPAQMMEVLQNVWLKAPIPNAEYLASLQMIGAQIERGTTQRALRGAGVPGTDSAAQYGMISSQAKTRIEGCENALEQALSWACGFSLKMVDRFFEAPVSVHVAEQGAGTTTIGPDNIKGHYQVTVALKPDEDSIKERKLMLANDAISKGGLARWDAYVFAGFDNPQEMIDRKDMDDLMQEPIIKRALAKRVVAAWGEDADALELEERAAEGKMQMNLSQIQQQMGLGTMGGTGDPMSPDGNPANNQQTPPAMASAMPVNQPPTQQQAAPSLPPGAPPAVAGSPIQGMMGDMRAMQRGPGG